MSSLAVTPFMNPEALGTLPVEKQRRRQEDDIENMLDEWNATFQQGDITLGKMKIKKFSQLVGDWLQIDEEMQRSVQKAEGEMAKKLEREDTERKLGESELKGSQVKAVEPAKSCWGNFWVNKKVGRIITALAVIAAIFSVAAGIVYSYETNDSPCPIPKVPLDLQTVAAVIMGLSGVAMLFQTVAKEDSDAADQKIKEQEKKERDHRDSEDKKKVHQALGNFKQEILAAISHDKQKQYEMFHLFTQALADFKKTKVEHEKSEKFRTCIDRLNRMPIDCSMNKRFPREAWISALIQALPDSNPLKSVVNDLYHIAMLKDSPSSTRRSRQTRPLTLEGAADGIEPEIEQEHKERDEAGLRQRDVVSASAAPQALSLTDSDDDLRGTKLLSQYQTKWSTLRSLLPCDVNFLQMRGVRFNKNCECIHRALSYQGDAEREAHGKERSAAGHASIELVPLSRSVSLTSLEQHAQSGAVSLAAPAPLARPDHVSISIHDGVQKKDDDADSPPDDKIVKLGKSPVTWARQHEAIPGSMKE